MILHGEDIIIKAGGVAIAAAKSCDINITTDTDEIANSSSGKWKQFMIGRSSWQVVVSQLVTTLLSNIQMVSTQITLEMSVKGNVGLPFDGLFNGETTEQQSYAGTPDAIYWDKTAKKFLGKVGAINPKYYLNWSDGAAYISPSDYDCFSYNNDTYVYLNSNLNADKLSGNAIVTTWKCTATRGNLAQGSFEFLGNGALTPASLPST
jgi:predicted secreted protein